MNSPRNADLFMFTLLIFIIFISNIFGNFILKLVPSLITMENIWIYQTIVSTMSFISPIILFIFIKKISIKEIIPLKPLSLKNIFLIIFMSITIQPLLQLIGSITDIFFKDEISNVLDIFAKLSLPKALFVTALVPAITEELAFRGAILTGYKSSSILIGVLMSSFYFGVMHLTFTQFFYTIVAGILFAFLVRVTNSIYSSILMHFLLNGSQITIAHIFYKYIDVSKEQMYNTNTVLLDLIPIFINFIFSLPFLILSLFLFIKVNKNEIKLLKQENNIIKNNINKPKTFTLFFYINILIYIIYMIFGKLIIKLLENR